MELSLAQPVMDPASDVQVQASAWEAAQVPIFIILMLACVVAGIWAIRAHARDRREAVAHAEARDRRLNELTRASDERIRTALDVELERSRIAYEHRSGEQWGRIIQEVHSGFDRLGKQLTGIETQFAGMHERTSVRFNEAMVVIQQAGLAAARLETRFRK